MGCAVVGEGEEDRGGGSNTKVSGFGWGPGNYTTSRDNENEGG